MDENDKQLAKTLNRLAALCKDSENGFFVAAANIDNRGLKVLLKSYAQQRSQFAAELESEVKRLGGKLIQRRSTLAAIHRGWIDIAESMTLGPYNTENTVLTECIRGERVALRRYRKALDALAPSESRTVIARQCDEIEELHERLRHLRGESGERLVVRLYDRDEDVARTEDALTKAGFARDSIETVPLSQMMSLYEHEGQYNRVVAETIMAAAAMGAVFGGAIGLIAGLSTPMMPGMGGDTPSSVFSIAVFIALVGIVAGAGFGGLLGALIGRGMSEEDAYLYDDGIHHGKTLMLVHTQNQRAMEAGRTMYEVNAWARAHPSVDESPMGTAPGGV